MKSISRAVKRVPPLKKGPPKSWTTSVRISGREPDRKAGLLAHLMVKRGMSELPRGWKGEVPQVRIAGRSTELLQAQASLDSYTSEIDQAVLGSPAQVELYQQALSFFETHMNTLDVKDCWRKLVYFARRVASLPADMRLDSFERLCRSLPTEGSKMPEALRMDVVVELQKALESLPPKHRSAGRDRVFSIHDHANRLRRFVTALQNAGSSPDIRQTRAGIIALLDEIPKETSPSARRQLVALSLSRWPHLFCDVEIAQAFINNVIASLPQGEDGASLMILTETLQKGVQGKLGLATPVTQQTLASILVPLMAACKPVDLEFKPTLLQAVFGVLAAAEAKDWVLAQAFHDLMECVLSLPEGEIKSIFLTTVVCLAAPGGTTRQILALEKGKETLVAALETYHRGDCRLEDLYCAYTIIEQLPEADRQELLPLSLTKLEELVGARFGEQFGVESLPEIWAHLTDPMRGRPPQAD